MTIYLTFIFKNKTICISENITPILNFRECTLKIVGEKKESIKKYTLKLQDFDYSDILKKHRLEKMNLKLATLNLLKGNVNKCHQKPFSLIYYFVRINQGCLNKF